MTRENVPGITDIIGVLLVVVALVSAGGLYYLASEYTKISDTMVSTEAEISTLIITRNAATGDVTVSILILLDNPSSLDIEIYRIEYMTYADRSTSTISEHDRFIGSGSSSDRNGTVQSESVREIQASHVVSPVYMDRFNYALNDGESLWTFLHGFVWFRMVNYPDVTKRLPISDLFQVEVQNV